MQLERATTWMWAPTLAALLAFAGCGPSTEAQTDVTGTDIEQFDIVAFDISNADGDTTADTGTDVSADVVTGDGLFGAPCAQNTDCQSSYCIDGYAGRVCTENCTDTCADGWSCRRDLAVVQDAVYICVPDFPNLCRPCDSNDACGGDSVSDGSACIPRGDDGSFCGGACAANACPNGYECLSVTNIEGGVSLQCMPLDDAECACSSTAISEGASTTCRNRNDLGACAGSRTCVATGLTDCDAPAAAAEVCNGRDDNCDARTDEEDALNCTDHFRDGDTDGYGRGGLARCLCGPDGEFRATVAGDCDDDAIAVNPRATEACNAIDDDCDGFTDEAGASGCEVWYRDGDQDDYGLTNDSLCLCEARGAYSAQDGGDCNDSTGLISPVAEEYCNSVDDDCDGSTDEEGALGCRLFYVDVDGDTYGSGEGRCLCGPTTEYSASRGGDCNDDSGAQNPGRREVCDVGHLDENCNNVEGEPNAIDCTDHYRDVDGDDYGVTTTRLCLCGPTGEWSTPSGGDCNDGSGNVNPDVVETCNGVDDNCDGRFDEGCGMQVGGWPTAKFSYRRTGFSPTYTGPLGTVAGAPSGSQRAAPAVKWRRQFGTSGAPYDSSPVFDLQGRMIIVVGDTVYKVNAANGDIIWQRQLPDTMSSVASPTLRAGGTIVVPSGNGITMLDANGNILWDRRLPGLPTEPITGAPMVDDDGVIYTVGYSAAYAIDPGGHVLWSVAVPNSQFVPSDVAWNNDNDRIYFGCSNHTLFALTRTGQIAWTYVVLDVDVDASTAVGADGALYQTFGSTFHKVTDLGNRGLGAGIGNGGSDMDTAVTVWQDGGGVEHVLTNANANTGLRSFRASDLVLSWTYPMFKDGSKNSTPAIDKDGRAYLGDSEGKFHAVNADGTRLWVYTLPGTAQHIRTTVALQDGAVFFGDSSGYIYCLED